MQLEKLKHVVAHTQIVRKLSAKSKQNKVSLTHLYKCKFVLWQKEKRNINKFTAKLTILCYNQLHTSLLSNGMAAIPKNTNFLSETKNVLSEKIVVFSEKIFGFPKIFFVFSVWTLLQVDNFFFYFLSQGFKHGYSQIEKHDVKTGKSTIRAFFCSAILCLYVPSFQSSWRHQKRPTDFHCGHKAQFCPRGLEQQSIPPWS